jgi:hypothetical protein
MSISTEMLLATLVGLVLLLLEMTTPASQKRF